MKKLKEIIKEDIKRFPVTIFILFAVTILWPLMVKISGDFNLLLIAMILIIDFSAFVVEVLVEDKSKRIIYYILSCVAAFFLNKFFLIIGLVLILVFKYKKSEKTLGQYISSNIIILLIIFLAFFIESFIVMAAVFSGLVGGVIVSFIVAEIGVFLFGFIFMPIILYNIGQL